MESLNARRFAEEWIEAFNSHDVETILRHYSPEVELISPLYRRYTDGRTDSVRGLDGLRRYFSDALVRYPDLRFTLVEVGTGSRGPCLRYLSNLDDRIAMECMELNSEGKAIRILCHYVTE